MPTLNPNSQGGGARGPVSGYRLFDGTSNGYRLPNTSNDPWKRVSNRVSAYQRGTAESRELAARYMEKDFMDKTRAELNRLKAFEKPRASAKTKAIRAGAAAGGAAGLSAYGVALGKAMGGSQNKVNNKTTKVKSGAYTGKRVPKGM